MDVSRSRRGVLALLSGVLGFCSVAAAQPRPFLFSTGRFIASWAGEPLSYDEALWDHMQNIGATMNGAGLCWCDAEPSPGVYDWDVIAYADHEVDGILARGMEVNFFLGLTPQWAKLHPDLPPHRTPPAEEYVDEFMDFHRFVADRYKDKVTYYYFWNEPNGCSWINEGCSNMDGYPLYTRWLIRCSQAVKEMDPDAKIIAGRLDYNAGVPTGYTYVQGMYDEGAGPWIDGIAIHPYDWSGGIHWQAITDTRNVMVANGDADKPIWLAEYGWNSMDYQWTANNLVAVLTELKKPEWSFVQMANYLVLNDGEGVENYGLMDANLNPRAGYFAFRDFDKTWPSTAGFSADVTTGSAPLTVQFTDTSGIQGATGWLWEFGDGASSAEQNPQHTYTVEGTFDVKLTVTVPGGSDLLEKPGFIRVGDFPRVAFIGGQLPQTPADAGVTEYMRSLGLHVDTYDDEPANRPTASELAASHDLIVGSSTLLSANVAGEFRDQPVPFVYWEAALGWCGNPDDRECLANGPTAIEGHTQINVLDNTHPIMAGLSNGLNTVASQATHFSFCTDTVAPGAQVLATAADNPANKAVIVAEPGALLLDGGTAVDKRVFLHMYDSTWLSANATGKQIFGNALSYTLGPPTAAFTADVVSGLQPLTVTFTDQSSGAVTSWSWNLGDGATSGLRHPSHTYQDAGTYAVSLTVGGPGGPDTHVRTGYIEVLATVEADFDSDGDVDLGDFGHLQACLTGSGLGPPTPECENTDLNADEDVDEADISLFADCLGGSGLPPGPGCSG